MKKEFLVFNDPSPDNHIDFYNCYRIMGGLVNLSYQYRNKINVKKGKKKIAKLEKLAKRHFSPACELQLRSLQFDIKNGRYLLIESIFKGKVLSVSNIDGLERAWWG